jgi:hypothetical protein
MVFGSEILSLENTVRNASTPLALTRREINCGVAMLVPKMMVVRGNKTLSANSKMYSWMIFQKEILDGESNV